MTIEKIFKKTQIKTNNIEYWLQLETDIMEWLKTKPNDKDVDRLYTETNYEMIKMICSGYRHANNLK